MPCIPSQTWRVGAFGGLVAAQAGDPHIRGREVLAQRPHLAQIAAPVRLALPELVAVQRGLLLERDPAPALDGDAEPLLEALPRLVGLGEEQSGVQREERRVGKLL